MLYIKSLLAFLKIFTIYIRLINKVLFAFVRNLELITSLTNRIDRKFINLYCVNQSKYEIVYICFRVFNSKLFVVK